MHLSILLVSNQELHDYSVYTPVFCASEGNVQHSSPRVGTKSPLFNPSEGVGGVQYLQTELLIYLYILGFLDFVRGTVSHGVVQFMQ